jgi:hypothetical protein
VKLVGDVARTIAAEPAVRDRMIVVFLPDYGVSLAERLIAACEVSDPDRPGRVAAQGDPQRRGLRKVLERSHDRRVRDGHPGGEAVSRVLARGWPGESAPWA